MSQSICLTPRQQQIYSYLVEYQQKNGLFPSPTQASRELCEKGLRVSGPNIYAMYGTLFIKGAFNGGTPLTDTIRARHSAKPVKTVDVSKLTLAPKPKPVAKGQDALAAALLELLKSSPQFNTFAAALNG
jgi:hypothetical protein